MDIAVSKKRLCHMPLTLSHSLLHRIKCFQQRSFFISFRTRCRELFSFAVCNRRKLFQYVEEAADQNVNEGFICMHYHYHPFAFGSVHQYHAQHQQPNERDECEGWVS
jgi:hypothetical protein